MVDWTTQTTNSKPEIREEDKLFLNEKPVKMLITISKEPDYGSSIARKVDTTYAHTVQTLQKLEDQGLTKTKKEGRKKIHSLTEEGEVKAQAFKQVLTGENP